MGATTELFQQQNRKDVAELLRAAHAHFDNQAVCDNWNGGTSTWALRLEAPKSVFAFLEPRPKTIEKMLHHLVGGRNDSAIALGTTPKLCRRTADRRLSNCLGRALVARPSGLSA